MTLSIRHELPPGENNPRNSEGSFLRAPDGSLLLGYSRGDREKEGFGLSRLAIAKVTF